MAEPLTSVRESKVKVIFADEAGEKTSTLVALGQRGTRPLLVPTDA